MRTAFEIALRQLISGVLFYSGLLRLWGRLSAQQPLIVYFHEVCAEPDDTSWCREPSLLMDAALFRSCVQYLNQHYKVVSLAEVTEHPSLKSLAITFDDGYRGVYRRAFPVLREVGAPATVFLVTGYIGAADCLWWDSLLEQVQRLRAIPKGERQVVVDRLGEKWRRLFSEPVDELAILNAFKQGSTSARRELREFLTRAVGPAPPAKERIFLSKEEIREMSAGGVEFGAHTETHPLLTWLSPDALRNEIRSAKRAVEELTKVRNCWFAYPDGVLNKEIEGAVREAGFTGAVQTFRSPQGGRFAIGRVGLNTETIRGCRGGLSPARLEIALSRLSRRTVKAQLMSFMRSFLPAQQREGSHAASAAQR